MATPLTPADGATVASGDGVAVTFTCPAYRPVEGQTTTSVDDYHAIFSRSADFVGTASSDAVATGDGRCSARYTDDLTPGRVYWRVSRDCYCPGASSESGPAASFTIRAPVTRLHPSIQARAFAGYAFTAHLRTDAPDGTRAILMLSRGGEIQVGAPTTVRNGRAAVDVSLSRGTHHLVWRIERGDQLQFSPKRKVTVVRARRWSTSASDDGRYRAKDVSFTVARRGREIRNLKASLTAFCVGATFDQNTIVPAAAFIRRARVAPDGRILARSTVSKTDQVLRGRLRHGKLSGGTIEVSFSTCEGSVGFTARRR